MFEHNRMLLEAVKKLPFNITAIHQIAELDEADKLIAELNKREKGVKPTYVENDLNDGSVYVCGSCGCPVSFKEFKATYCYKCGDKVLWESEEIK